MRSSFADIRRAGSDAAKGGQGGESGMADDSDSESGSPRRSPVGAVDGANQNRHSPVGSAAL